MGDNREYRVIKELQSWFWGSDNWIVVTRNGRSYAEKKARKELLEAKQSVIKNIAEMKKYLKVIGKYLDEEKVCILDEGYECRWDCRAGLLAAA